jgi:hypothetical protein
MFWLAGLPAIYLVRNSDETKFRLVKCEILEMDVYSRCLLSLFGVLVFVADFYHDAGMKKPKNSPTREGNGVAPPLSMKVQCWRAVLFAHGGGWR